MRGHQEKREKASRDEREALERCQEDN